MEAVNLLSSNKYTEKQIASLRLNTSHVDTWKSNSDYFHWQGYLFISVLVNNNSDLIRLIIQSIKNDLGSRNPIHVNLALQCIANIGSKEMAESFGTDIPKLLVSGSVFLDWIHLRFDCWHFWFYCQQGHDGCGQAIGGSVPAAAVEDMPWSDTQRWMDITDHSFTQRSAFGSCNSCCFTDRSPGETQRWWVQGLCQPSRFTT